MVRDLWIERRVGATDMGSAGMVDVGQLARERHGAADVVLVGFGGHRGSVIGRRYDAFLFFDDTEALHPLALEEHLSAEMETYPWGT